MFKKIVQKIFFVWAILLGDSTIWASNNIISDWAKSPYGSVRVISGASGTIGGNSLPLGLEFELPKGWKIYHKDSGDAGFPPIFIDESSENVALSELQFPKPIQFEFAGIITNGYEKHVILPWDIRIIDENKPVHINGVVEYLACEKVCVPVRGQVSLKIPAILSKNTMYYADIEQYRATVGESADDLDANGLNNVNEVSILWVIGIALLGGLILNIMPCVLPVLSLKTIGIINQAGQGRRVMRTEMLYMAVGIISTFVLMALILSILKVVGVQIGWGIQFQQPVFLSIMMTIMIVFAGNVMGIFHIMPPSIVQELPFLKSHASKAFYNGVLATILATPCSAPFLGTAVGFALGGSVLEIIFVFMFLGLGMAMPYIVLGLFPAWTKYMPKAGKWLITVKNIMGMLMVGMAIYLAWILWLNIGLENTVMLILMSGAIIFVLGVSYKSRLYKIRYALVLLLSFAIVHTASEKGQAYIQKNDTMWQVFSASKIDNFVANKKIVFVDITASWCITCQVNKATSLDRAKVMKVLQRDDVVAIRGDWTQPNAEISAFLERYGRYGIPFNVVYSQAYPKGIVLPEILSPSIVLEAIKKAQQ